MIVKIASAGADPGNLMRYLAGPGRHGEHQNQRCVAGSVESPGHLTNELANLIASDLRLTSQMHPDVSLPKGEIYHVSLSLAADEGDLTDGKWRALAEDYMRGMGYDDPAKAPMRWVAVNHGLNVKGNPHVHIVANLIREDGTKANTWQDMPRSQKLATQLEQKHGLNVLQSRIATAGAGAVPYTAGEAGKARDQGHPIERLDLERRVRSLAVASQTEAEFVRRIRADGLLVRPYPTKGEVTGYSVGIPAPPDAKQVFFQGGRLARDLSLPRLRASWPNGGGSAATAGVEWRMGVAGAPAHPGGRETKPVASTPQVQAAVEQELHRLGEQLGSMDPQEFAAASHDLAGVLAAGSRAVEGDRIGEVGRAARDVGSWAQSRKTPARHRPIGRGSALLLMQALDPLGPTGQAVMYRQLVDTAMALYRLHRAHRPVTVKQGRVGAGMPEGDGIDDTMESMGTVALTLGARAVMEHANSKAEELEASYSLSGDEVRGMSDEQRSQARPDPGDLDWRPGMDGASGDATATQQDRLAALLVDPDERSKVGELTRAEAAAKLRDLEDRLGPMDTRDAYVRAGLDVPTRRQFTPGDAARGGVKSPLDWKDAGAPVTSAQRYTLSQAGLSPDEIGQLDKGHASLVISAIPDGATRMRQVYDNNTVGAMIMGTPDQPLVPKSKPNPVTAKPQGRSPRRM